MKISGTLHNNYASLQSELDILWHVASLAAQDGLILTVGAANGSKPLDSQMGRGLTYHVFFYHCKKNYHYIKIKLSIRFLALP